MRNKIRKLKHINIIGKGGMCRKCGEPTEIRKRVLPPPNKSFYYKKWEYCRKCNAVYFNENDKSMEWKEVEQQESFFNSI